MNKWFGKMKKERTGSSGKKIKRRHNKEQDLNQMKRGDSILDDESDDDQNNYSSYNNHHEQQNSNSSSYNNNNNHHHHQNHEQQHSNSYSNSNDYQSHSPRSNKHKRKSRNSMPQEIKLYVGDKILLANKRSGKVTSLGPKPDKDGTWVRVVMDNPHVSSTDMFSNSTSKNKTIWVPIQRVDKILSHGKKFDITINDRVIERKKRIHGSVKYVGPTHFDKGVWFGVELDAPRGKNNGTVKKKFYFKSRDNHGVMLPFKRLEHEESSKKSKSKKRSYSQNWEKDKKNSSKNGHGKGGKHHQKTNSDGMLARGQTNNNARLELDKIKNNKNNKNNYNNNINNNNNNNNNNINNNKDIQRQQTHQQSTSNHQSSHNHMNGNNNMNGYDMNGMNGNNHMNGTHNINEYDNNNNNNNTDNNNNHQIHHDEDMNGNSNHSKTPSSDSDDAMMYVQLQSPSQPTSRKKPTKLTPKEKIPFQGWKKLIDDDDEKEINSPTPSPSPYVQNNMVMNNINGINNMHTKPHELDENNLKILKKFLTKIKEFTGVEKELYDSNLPSITEVNKEQRETIFVRKLYLCQAQCDFFDQSDQMQELIEKKERMLLELSEFIARHVWFKESLYEKCLTTVSYNLFRALPFQDRPPALSFFNDEVFDKDTNFEDPAWRHLKLVYDLTWRVINTPQVTAAMMEKHMTGKFIGNLVELFASEDHRERAYLMMILHKIYGRCLKLRPYIIQIMSGYFYRMIYADEFQHVNGIIELLQIICAIIPGLTVPVKESWQQFVRNILVPLHKCRGLKKFWEQLTQCCVNYVAKDEDGGAVILGGLLRFWPQQSPQKEEIFIMEVVNIINVLITHQHGFSYENYKEVLVSAANKLTQCMLSTRQPVAERAIAAWKEQSMQRLVDYDRKAFLPKLCEAFYRNREHPNAALKQSSTAVEKIYRSKDSAYWKKMQQYLAKKDKKENAIAKAIADAQLKNKDPYDIVKAKHAKDNQKKKRPKPLTVAEKKAKRNHYWKKVQKNC